METLKKWLLRVFLGKHAANGCSPTRVLKEFHETSTELKAQIREATIRGALKPEEKA